MLDIWCTHTYIQDTSQSRTIDTCLWSSNIIHFTWPFDDAKERRVRDPLSNHVTCDFHYLLFCTTSRNSSHTTEPLEETPSQHTGGMRDMTNCLNWRTSKSPLIQWMRKNVEKLLKGIAIEMLGGLFHLIVDIDRHGKCGTIFPVP